MADASNANGVFRIPIVAINKTTSGVAAANASMRKLTQPVTELRKSVGLLGREAGLDKLGKSFVNTGKAAIGAVREVAKIGVAVAAVAGVGATAGIVEMTRAWTDQGAEVARTSRAIGVYQGDLQSLRGAARLFGVDAESLTGGLAHLGDTLEDALYGRNQQALVMLNRLQIALHRTKDGSIDSADAMKQLADRIADPRINIQQKRFLANMFGLGNMMPFLMQGAKGIEAYQREAERLGAVMTPAKTEQALAFARSQARLGLALEGTRNTIVSGLIPAFQPIIDHTTEWLAANQALIRTDVAYYGRKIADAVNSIDWEAVKSGVRDVIGLGRGLVHTFGLAGTAAIALGVTLGAPLIGSLFGVGRAVVGLTATIIANPFAAAIVGGVGLAIVAGYELWKHWSAVKSFFEKAWNIPVVRALIVATMPLIGIAVAIKHHWDEVKHLWEWFETSWVGRHLFGTGSPGASAPTAAPSRGGVSAPAAAARTALAAASASIIPITNGSPQALFGALETQNGLPNGLLDRVWATESGRGKHMFSPAGAQGHFQFMPGTARQYGVNDPFDLTQSATGAAHYLSDLNSQFGGDIRKSVAAYNWGPGNLQHDISLNGDAWESHLPGETRNYLARVVGPYETMASAANSNETASAATGTNGRARVDIVISGAPAGTTASVSGPGSGLISVRVERSMATPS